MRRVEAFAGSNNSKTSEHLSPPPSGRKRSLVLSNISRESLETEISAIGLERFWTGIYHLKGFRSVNKKPVTSGSRNRREQWVDWCGEGWSING